MGEIYKENDTVYHHEFREILFGIWSYKKPN